MASAKQVAELAITNTAKQYHQKVPAYAKDALKWANEKQLILRILTSTRGVNKWVPESIEQAILNAGAMGLSFNEMRPEVYFIPRAMWRADPKSPDPQRRKPGPLICYASPSYIGLNKIAVDSGFAKLIRPQIVFKGDTFQYFGPDKEPNYEMSLSSKQREEDALGVYCIVQLKDGGVMCEWMNRETVQKIRGMSDNGNSIMWHPDKLWTEGWKKAVMRRTFKTVPVSMGGAMSLANEIMNASEGVTVEGESFEVSPAPAIEYLGVDAQIDINDRINAAAGVGETDEQTDSLQKRLNSLMLQAYHVESIDKIPATMYQAVVDRIDSYMERSAK